MRRLMLTGILALLLVAPAAATGAGKVLDMYCSPESGDVCTYATQNGGRITLELRTFSFSGNYKLCVQPPKGARQCKTFMLTKNGQIYSGRVDLARNFTAKAKGEYSATWRGASGFKIGPALMFTR